MNNEIVKSKKKKQSNIYFTQATEDAIVAYNMCNDFKIKSRIYDTDIHQAFFKLTQNIIHTFKFYYTDVDEIEDLQHEVITFLLTKIHLYNHAGNIQDRLNKIIKKEFKQEYEGNFVSFVKDPNKITQLEINTFISKLNVSKDCMDKLIKLTPPKAYSYFGTITKRYLILYNDNNYKKRIKKSPISILEEDGNYSYSIDDTITSTSSQDKLSIFTDSFIKYATDNIYQIFPKSQDAKIADAILELFRKREYLSIFNKKALYINIREIINAKTPKITKIADKLYSVYKKGYSFYIDNGYIKF